MTPDPDTMIERHRRLMRRPWLTMNKLMIGCGIALTVLAFFFALSGCPERKAHGAEPSHLTDPEIVVVDVHDPDSIRAAMDGAGYARVELDPNRYIGGLVRCITGIQRAFPDIPTEDIGVAGVWHIPDSGSDYHALCTARHGITIDRENAQWMCGLLKRNVLDFRDSQIVCGYTREDGRTM